MLSEHFPWIHLTGGLNLSCLEYMRSGHIPVKRKQPTTSVKNCREASSFVNPRNMFKTPIHSVVSPRFMVQAQTQLNM